MQRFTKHLRSIFYLCEKKKKRKERQRETEAESECLLNRVWTPESLMRLICSPFLPTIFPPLSCLHGRDENHNTIVRRTTGLVETTLFE